jgi:nitroreductase
MKEINNTPKSLTDIIKSRRSTRSFSKESPSDETINEIVTSAIYAPYGGATGIPLKETRKIFVFSQNTGKFNKARELLLNQIQKNTRKMNVLLCLLPFLRKKMQPFCNILNMISKNGIPSLQEASHYIVIAEKKGFPPVEKQSIAHAMQNMWLSATNMGLGFQLVSATGIMANNKQFIELLGLPLGDYTIDGCVIGVPNTIPENTKAVDSTDFVTWIK